MNSNHLPLKKEIINLLHQNSDLLADDLRRHLENNNKLSHFDVSDIYPQLYYSLFSEIIEYFDVFNNDQKYTKEIQKNIYSEEERQCYYNALLIDTASKLMTFRRH